MEPLPRNARLARRARWLIQIRWIAIAGIVFATLISCRLLHIRINEPALYAVAAVLAAYNTSFLVLLRPIAKANTDRMYQIVHRIVSAQISLDLVMLTILLHFSGGIENPFVVYFVFHMVIASILLPKWESYLQAALAVALITLLVLLESNGWLHHYCLEAVGGAHCGGLFAAARVFVLATALFTIVYMASSIATQLRNKEEAYWQANIQLQEKDNIKDEYVARVTHDIKAHLAAIQSCLELVQNKALGELNDRQAEFVGRAMKRVETLIAFIKALLRLTRLRLSNQYEVQEFSLREVIANAANTAQPRAESKGIRLTVTLDHASDTIVGNSVAIEEMIANLLLNAVKYTLYEGSVALRAADAESGLRIEIADTGIGIPEAELPHVFEEFFRATNARKIERDGTGLGLAIARQIVARHNGSISVESREGQGTTFTVLLPRSQTSGLLTPPGGCLAEFRTHSAS